MKRFALADVLLVSTGLLVSSAVFAAEPLEVKTGEWEITSTIQTQGLPPMPAAMLEKMTPEQRAKMAALFGQREAGDPKVHKSQECITKKDLEKPLHPDEEAQCESTILKSDGKTQDIALNCKGERPSTGRMHVEATSPESMKGEFDLAFAGGDDALKIHSTLDGRWLGPTCKKEDEEE